MLRNKLRAMLSVKQDYQRLQYIESTGKQIIETGIKPENNLTVFMDFQLTETVYGSTNTFCCAYYADNNRYRPLKVEGGYFNISVMSGYTSVAKITADKKRHTILFNDANGNALWDGVNKGKVYKAITPPDNIGLGVFGQCQRSSSTPNYAPNSLVKMRLYELIGYDKTSKKEIYHAVPVLDSNGIPCLYDMVSKRFEYDTIGLEVFDYAV